MASASARRLAVALVVSLSAGCAARAPAPAPTPVGVRAVAMRTSLVTVEQADPRLAQALAALGSVPAPGDLLNVAEAYRRAGIGDKAMEYYTRALQAEPRNAVALDGQARVWRDWGFPGVGLADAHRAVYHAPASAECRNTLGTILQALGHAAVAREQYMKAAALDARAGYAHANVCALDLMEGRPSAAIDACRRALDVEPGLESARRNLARAEALLSREKSGESHARH
jgi:Flp pilus assembly protein TadD